MATSARIGRNPFVNAPGTTNGALSKDILVPCACCLKPFRPKRPPNRFCSSRCRLLFWAAGELVEVVYAGRAEGLRPMLKGFGHE